MKRKWMLQRLVLLGRGPVSFKLLFLSIPPLFLAHSPVRIYAFIIKPDFLLNTSDLRDTYRLLSVQLLSLMLKSINLKKVNWVSKANLDFFTVA